MRWVLEHTTVEMQKSGKVYPSTQESAGVCGSRSFIWRCLRPEATVFYRSRRKGSVSEDVGMD